MCWAKASGLTATVTPSSASCRTVFGSRGSMPTAFEPWELENRGGHNYQAIGRLKPGVTLAAARAEMKGITERLSQQFELSRGWSVTMLPLQEQLVRGSE